MNDIASAATWLEVLDKHGFTIFFGVVVTTVCALSAWKILSCSLSYGGRVITLWFKQQLRNNRVITNCVTKLTDAQTEIGPALRLIHDDMTDGLRTLGTKFDNFQKPGERAAS